MPGTIQMLLMVQKPCTSWYVLKNPINSGQTTKTGLHHRRITWQGTRGNRDWDARTNWDGTNPCRQRLLEARGWGTTSRFKPKVFLDKNCFGSYKVLFTWRMGAFSGRTDFRWVITTFFFVKRSPNFPDSQTAMKMAYYMGVGVLAGMMFPRRSVQRLSLLCFVV